MCYETTIPLYSAELFGVMVSGGCHSLGCHGYLLATNVPPGSTTFEAPVLKLINFIGNEFNQCSMGCSRKSLPLQWKGFWFGSHYKFKSIIIIVIIIIIIIIIIITPVGIITYTCIKPRVSWFHLAPSLASPSISILELRPGFFCSSLAVQRQFVLSLLYPSFWGPCWNFHRGFGREIFCNWMMISGLENNLNSSFPFGQVALKFCLPRASLWLLFLQFSWQMTYLGPCPVGKWEWKVTCPTGKSPCPGQLNGTFFEPWIYFSLLKLSVINCVLVLQNHAMGAGKTVCHTSQDLYCSKRYIIY